MDRTAVGLYLGWPYTTADLAQISTDRITDKILVPCSTGTLVPMP